MRKNFELVKTVQLILFVAISFTGLYVIFTDDTLYQMIGSNASVRVLCALLWLVLALSFLFILWDFTTHSSFKKDYRELDYAVYNDHIAGIANRYSCDAMIEKYIDTALPETIGCIMLDISNIREINAQYGHKKGNETIQEFSNILYSASVGICFVGRNGGNKFMALFESCEEEKLDTFLTRIDRRIEANNKSGDKPKIEYRTGRAFQKDEHAETITQLIALSDRRLQTKTDTVTGFANRASCDEIIALYLDKPLPENMASMMLEISNIREVNEKYGHLAGNQVIREFGDILQQMADGKCFTGRNGGMKFLALFENSSQQQLDQFVAGIQEKVDTHNEKPDTPPIRFNYGVAFREDPPVGQIDRLVALSDRRLRAAVDAAKEAENVQSGL